mmetsp:Transcript_17534/g.49321  ORF Transcript_17534/g.49321 Transcript_17534/m.49321 type:complete len:293 (-) Transcript_17534:91-969(-)
MLMASCHSFQTRPHATGLPALRSWRSSTASTTPAWNFHRRRQSRAFRSCWWSCLTQKARCSSANASSAGLRVTRWYRWPSTTSPGKACSKRTAAVRPSCDATTCGYSGVSAPTRWNRTAERTRARRVSSSVQPSIRARTSASESRSPRSSTETTPRRNMVDGHTKSLSRCTRLRRTAAPIIYSSTLSATIPMRICCGWNTFKSGSWLVFSPGPTPLSGSIAEANTASSSAAGSGASRVPLAHSANVRIRMRYGSKLSVSRSSAVTAAPLVTNATALLRSSSSPSNIPKVVVS